MIKKYVLGSFAHPNHTGELIALGFFPALGLFFYAWRAVQKRKIISNLILYPVMAGAIALALILFLSRGSLVSFFGAFAVYMIAILIKFPSRTQRAVAGGAFLVLLGMVAWSGEPQRIWKELQTIQTEFLPGENSSLAENREGAHRALSIFRVHPLWGVGTGRYWTVSRRFASEKFVEESAEYERAGENALANFKAMSHYLQVLAEEGAGAIFYFLFLLSCFLKIALGLIQTESRFQFYSALSLALAAGMILFHASFHFLMEQFPIALMVYILLGASVGVLQKDFVRD